jgi:hypothetical protein
MSDSRFYEALSAIEVRADTLTAEAEHQAAVLRAQALRQELELLSSNIGKHGARRGELPAAEAREISCGQSGRMPPVYLGLEKQIARLQEDLRLHAHL